MERSNCPGKAQSWWPLSHSLPRDGCAILCKESTAEVLTVGKCQWQKVGTTGPAAHRSEEVTTLPEPILLPAGMVFPDTFQTHQPLSSCALKVFKVTEPSRGAGSLAKTNHVSCRPHHPPWRTFTLVPLYHKLGKGVELWTLRPGWPWVSDQMLGCFLFQNPRPWAPGTLGHPTVGHSTAVKAMTDRGMCRQHVWGWWC